MPRKGGGGGNPPDEEEQTIRTSEGVVASAVDRSTEFEEDGQDFVYGDIVHDEEPEDPDDLVVVNLPDARADEWKVDGGTLAEKHPTCPAWDDVIIVVPLLELDEYMSEWDERKEEIPRDQLEEDDITTFVYPSMRLDLIEPSHLRSGDS
jgi:hypothetical protein